MWPDGIKNRLPRKTVEGAEQHFWETYGGPWHFNQVVGWLWISIAGSQIRADLWFTRAKRLQRRPQHRQIALVGKAFELHCWPKQSSTEIYRMVLDELRMFQKEFRGGRMVLDLECFSNVGTGINWRALVAPSLSRKRRVG